ncbi:hypothetical protein QAD02_018783 [Eretmocerus hayati]|uniref:Uncharacterized protein n=1 Tax=Eretmocerus hayati TaxID=131215 RepID=A0ACC2PJH7_9HYME|nr:hypothetical protein QAD02_018783 [Eretmocerus hayati]
MDHKEVGKLKCAILHGQKHIVESILERNTAVDCLHDSSDSDLRPPLHAAVYLGDLEIIKKLLDRGASPNAFNEINETTLMLAAKFGKYDIVDLLLSDENLMNCINDENFSHFHIACMRDRVDIVKKLVEQESDINSIVNSQSMRWAGYTPLHFAAEFHSVRTVEFLLSIGANIIIKNSNQLTALHLADMVRNERIIDLILEAHRKVAHNPANREGLSHFHIACTRNNPEIVECFIKNGVGLNESVDGTSLIWNYYTAIDFAIYYDCIDNVKLLLAEGGRDNFPSNDEIDRIKNAQASGNVELINLILQRDKLTSNGRIRKIPSLHSACINDDLETIKNLTPKAIGKLNKPTWQGSTPLHLAIEREDDAIIKYLLDSGADYNMKNSDGKTSLHLAYERDLKTIIKWILEDLNKLTENHVDRDALSYLHIACATDECKAVEHLIDLGANINAQVNKYSNFFPGYTPLHFAVKFGSIQVIPVLLSHGASISALDKNDQSAFDVAILEFYEDHPDDFPLKIIKEILSHQLTHNEGTFNDRGFSLLHVLSADLTDQTKAMNDFISKHSSDVNKVIDKVDTCWDGFTPLHFAMATGHAKNAKLLVGMGADFFSKASNGDLPFHLILDCESDPDRAFYIPEFPSDPVDFARLQHNPVGTRGYSLFHIACSMGNVKWVKYFLDHGVDPNLRVTERPTLCCHEFYAETPLHAALTNSGGPKLEIVKLLLENGANAMAQDHHLSTPLHYMPSNNEPEIIDLLISYGADVNSYDASLGTPLHEMCENTFNLKDEELREMIVSLLNYGADINLIDELDSSPLSSVEFYCRLGEFTSSVEVLMEHFVKLKRIGLNVSKGNKKTFRELLNNCSNDFQSKLPTFKKQCAKEVKQLQNIRIGDYNMTMNEILLKDFIRLPVTSDNDQIQLVVNLESFQKQFPIYGPMLKMQVKMRQIRRELLENSLKVLDCLIKNLFPRECLQLILEFLPNTDLNSLIMCKNELPKSIVKCLIDNPVPEQI